MMLDASGDPLIRRTVSPHVNAASGLPLLAQVPTSPTATPPTPPLPPTTLPAASPMPTPTPTVTVSPKVAAPTPTQQLPPVSAWDVLLLITYVVCILTALARIRNSFNDEYTVRLDAKALQAYLAEQKLEAMIGISFGFDKRYEFGKNDKLRKLSISITNKSSTHSIYVDWDYCILSDFGNRARRVTRLMPGTTLDLFQPQAFSAIAPGTTLKESITAEDVLKRKAAKDDKIPVALEMEVAQPLLNFGGVDKKKSARFMASLQTLEFFLDLAVRFVGPARSSNDHAIVRCKFMLQKLPWQSGLPWNPK